ncbi:HupE/UreJ family protein [Kineococcus sp. SYSU DK018]|uniref:HupE/UreJ family protein n=1 Tax=Kineococcus sp. SYSU DK018 TaxID=3383139 RepID=UPI003D7F1563
MRTASEPGRRPLPALLAAVLLAVAALVAGAVPASAHPMPNTLVQLDVHEDSITAELQVPVDDLALASGVDLRGEDAEGVLAAQQDELRGYLAAHLTTTTPDGVAWDVQVGELSLGEAEQTSTGTYREVVTEAVLTPPAGADVRRFTFAADLVVHEVVTDSVVVAVRTDWAGGLVSEGDEAEQVGVITVDNSTLDPTPLEVDLDEGSAWNGSTAMLRLGADHILAGTDHLLFLLTLLLPAPLLAARGRWAAPTGGRRAVRRIAGITLAFTVGHSATLAISALGRFTLPTAPIESFIALSILIGAVHALRPLFPGREALVAAVFGLVHGMAFSFTLAELELSTGQLLLSLLGFNLGIELMQLLVVALVLPCFVVLARTRWYRPVRVVGAVCAGVAAAGWLLDRLGVANAVARAADSAGASGWWVVAGLAVLAALSTRLAPRVPAAGEGATDAGASGQEDLAATARG